MGRTIFDDFVYDMELIPVDNHVLASGRCAFGRRGLHESKYKLDKCDGDLSRAKGAHPKGRGNLSHLGALKVVVEEGRRWKKQTKRKGAFLKTLSGCMHPRGVRVTHASRRVHRPREVPSTLTTVTVSHPAYLLLNILNSTHLQRWLPQVLPYDPLWTIQKATFTSRRRTRL